MSSSPDSPAAAGLPDIFTPMQPLLMMCSVANHALISRPKDPLPRALAELTDFGPADVARVTNLTDAAGLYELLREAPELFANYLLLGRLTFASPLGRSLAAHVSPDDSADAEEVAQRRAQLLAYVAHYGPVQSELTENYLLACYEDEDREEATQERAAFRTAVETAFTDWQHSLGARLLAAPAPVLPESDEGGWSIRPLQVQLDTLVLAITTVLALPGLGSPRFADAVQRLPDFHPQRLEELRDYLEAAEAEEHLSLTRTQGMLLYLASHLTLLTFLNDLLDGEGLDDLLLRHQEASSVTPEMVTHMREATAVMLGAYIDLIREHEGDTEDFRALEVRLAPVLALGSA